MRFAIPLFPRVTALDAIGPYEVLQRLPGATVTFVGAARGEVRSENGFLGMSVDASWDELTDPEVVVMPGGVGARALVHDDLALAWLRNAYDTARFVTSVCTGSLVLAAAGLLDGLSATTHWSAYESLRSLGAIPTTGRFIEHLDRRIITAAGVSAGIDMALRLSELLTDQTTAQAQQLLIEYDPAPPFDAGSVEKAGPEVMSRALELAALKD